MKNKLTICIGILLIFMIVWGATLFAIKHQKKIETQNSQQTFILKR